MVFALQAGGTFAALAVGSATWLASIALKGIAARALNKAIARQPIKVSASLHGVLSAVTELGLAYIALVAFKVNSLPNALTFGIGAATAEVVYVLYKGFSSPPNEDAVREWERWARVSLCVRYAVPLERLVAGIGHVSSRGLLFVSVKLASAAGFSPALAALFFFSLTDGAAYYGHLAKWNWSDPKVCRTFYGALGALEAIEVFVFVLALRWIKPA